MSIQGNLETMSLQAILRWAEEHGETGVFELERNKVCKRIAFRNGEIVVGAEMACFFVATSYGNKSIPKSELCAPGIPPTTTIVLEIEGALPLNSHLVSE